MLCLIAELRALTRALILAQDKQAGIYTDSKYAYNIIHSDMLIWRPGIPNTRGTPIASAKATHTETPRAIQSQWYFAGAPKE